MDTIFLNIWLLVSDASVGVRFSHIGGRSLADPFQADTTGPPPEVPPLLPSQHSITVLVMVIGDVS